MVKKTPRCQGSGGERRLGVEFLKALHVLELSWWTQVCNVAGTLGAVPLDWQTKAVVFWNWRRHLTMCLGESCGKLFGIMGCRAPLCGLLLYNQSQSLGRIARTKSDLFLVTFGLRQGYPVSLILDNQGVEEIQFDCVSAFCRCGSVGPIIPWPPALTVSKSEAAGLKSEVIVISQKKVECLLPAGEEILPQVKEFKYLGDLLTSEWVSATGDRSVWCLQWCGLCAHRSWWMGRGSD